MTLDPWLVERVLEQVSAATASQTSGEDGSGTSTDTAFVQLVMKRLWDEEQAAGSRTLHLATLERLGGATTIIGTHLDTSMAKLSEEEQDVAASAFRFLVTPERAKIALGTKALSDWTGIDEAKLESVLGALSMPDLRILRPVVLGGRGDRHRFEIFHDGLAEPILSWRGRYEQIELEQERAAKEVAQREAAESASREEHERRRRRQYARAAAVFLTAFLASLVVLAFYYRAQTSKEKDNNLSIRIAERVATLTSAPNFGPGAAALASIEADRLSPTVQARNGELTYLQNNPDLPKIGVGHSRAVSSVTFVPGSQILASASYDGTVRLWDADGHTVGSPVVAPTNSTVGLTSIIASSGTPKLLAVGRDDGGVDVWSLADATKPKHLETLFVSDGARVNAVTFSPDGRYLVAGDGDGGLTGWDTSTLLSGNAKAPSAFHRTIDGEVNALQYCPDSAPKEARGVLAVATSSDGWLWKPVVGSTGPTVKAYAHPALSAACAPDGTFAYGIDNTTDPGILISPWSGKLRYIETSDVVQSLAFTDGGKTLVSGGSDWMVTTWDVASGRSFGAPMSMGAFNTVNGVAVSGDGSTIAAAGDGDQIKIWPAHTQAPLARTIGSLDETGCCIRSRSFGTGPTIMQLAVGGSGQVATATVLGVSLWRAKPAAGTEIPQPLTTIPSSYSPIAYYGNLLAVGSGNGFALWNTAAPCDHGAVLPASCRLGITSPPSSANGPTILEFNRTGKVLEESTAAGETQLWDVSNPRSPKLLSSLPKETQSIDGAAFSPLADLLAIGGNDGTLEIWDVSDPRHPKLSTDIPGAHEGLPVSAIAFSPTTSVLATGGEDQQVRIWTVDPAAATTAARLSQTAEFGQTNTIEALAFSPDGRVLASGDGDGSTCLYDVQLVRTIGSSDCLLGHGSQHGLYFSGIPTVEFLPDGSALLTAGQDNPLVSWDSSLWSPSGNAIEAPICQSAGNELDALQWSEAFSGTPLAGRRKPVCAPSPG